MRVSLSKELIYCRAWYALHTDVCRLSKSVLAFGASSNISIMRLASTAAGDGDRLAELPPDTLKNGNKLNITNIKAAPTRTGKLVP
jgi:hypothetical protein